MNLLNTRVDMIINENATTSGPMAAMLCNAGVTNLR